MFVSKRNPVDPDPELTEIKSRLLLCASIHPSIGRNEAPRFDHTAEAFPDGNRAFCEAMLHRWRFALEGALRPAGTRASLVRATAERLTPEALSFDPRIPGARIARHLFLRLRLGERTREILGALVEARRGLAGDREDLHAYFAILANRISLDDPSASPFDRSLTGFLTGGDREIVRTSGELELFSRAYQAAQRVNAVQLEAWLESGYSQLALRRKARAERKELGDKDPIFIDLVPSVPQPENHDFLAVQEALAALLLAGYPDTYEATFRRDWAEKLVWLADIGLNPDRHWRGRAYGDGVVPRSFLWFWIAHEQESRARFDTLVTLALAECEKRAAPDVGKESGPLSPASLSSVARADSSIPDPESPPIPTDSSDRAILDLLAKHAVSPSDDFWSAEKIGRMALGIGKESLAKRRCARLHQAGHLDARKYRGGGYRINATGQALRAQLQAVSPGSS